MRLEPQLEQRRCMRTSDAPYRAMLSYQLIGVVRCVPGRARRSTAAAWDKRVFIAWCGAIARMRITSPGTGGQKFAPGSGAPHVHHAQRILHRPAWSNNMASFSVGQCVVLQFTPDPWSVRITISWCACTPPWSTKTCRGKFRV